MNLVMLDLETFSLEPNATILQIAAIKFNLFTGEIYSEFNRLIDPTTCVDVGLDMSPSTVLWWLQQSQAAIDSVFNKRLERTTIHEALGSFNLWYSDDSLPVMGNGPRADNQWLDSAYKACNMPNPVKYYNDCCFRTLKLLAKAKTQKEYQVAFEGVKHNALADCRHQAKLAYIMMKDLLE